MTKDELIEFVTDELTVSDSLKIEVNKKEVDRIIRAELKHVYMDWRDIVEPVYGVIPLDSFKSAEFKASRSIQMPECCWGIEDMREINSDGSKLFGMNSPDLGINRVFYSDAFLSPMSNNFLVDRLNIYSSFDQLKSFTNSEISFDFTPATHRIHVNGHDPIRPVYVRALMGIPEDEVFSNYWFQRLVIGKAFKNYHRSMKFFDGNLLINGVQITTIFNDEGDKCLEEVKEYIKGNDQPDWFYMFQ